MKYPHRYRWRPGAHVYCRHLWRHARSQDQRRGGGGRERSAGHGVFLAPLHTLDAIVTLTAEHEAQWATVRATPFTEGERDPLEAMLIRPRRDGVARNALMKQHLDALAANTTALAALLDAYGPDARTPAFKAEARHFSEHAILWRDRWNSLLELFMAGGDYPAAEAAPPPGLAAAVAAEQQAAQ
jgi:hypothetical protein